MPPNKISPLSNAKLIRNTLELHSGNTQTYIDPDRKAELMTFIQWKLGNWEAPHHQSRWREFDDAIRALCEATIRECDLTRVDGVG